MGIKFFIKKQKGIATIYLRFYINKEIDLHIKSGLLIESLSWNKNKEKARNNLKLNANLSKLKAFILERYNESYSFGENINSSWLNNVIKDCFQRPQQEGKKEVYFTDFIKDLTEGDNETSERMENFLKQYRKKILLFQEKNKTKLKISEISPQIGRNIMEFLEKELNYSNSTISKLVQAHNFLLERAESYKLDVLSDYKCIYTCEKRKLVLEPYLDLQEIQKLYDFDFSCSDRLDNVRDNFIIGLCTGLRVSDYLKRLRIDNISEDFIEIRTKKTNRLVAVPLHWMVKETLNKRLGMLPVKISNSKFNLYVKDVCQAVGIDKEMEGYLNNPKTNRKELGLYPKYKLISSHTARRSFASNNFGKISDHDLQQICGWSNTKTMMNYIKKTSRDSAIRLQKVWDKQSN